MAFGILVVGDGKDGITVLTVGIHKLCGSEISVGEGTVAMEVGTVLLSILWEQDFIHVDLLGDRFDTRRGNIRGWTRYHPGRP